MAIAENSYPQNVASSSLQILDPKIWLSSEISDPKTWHANMASTPPGLKVHSKSTDHQSLLKHRNFDFALSTGGGGDNYFKSDF